MRREIAAVLDAYGEVFTGGRAGEVADEWIACGFTDPDDVNGWCMASVWEPSVAAALRSEGVGPHKVSEIQSKLTAGLSREERAALWTDGCPVYSICNGDTPVTAILNAVNEEVSDE
jgi:hypothetical protein